MTTIYLLRGGDKKTGFWFVGPWFNYRKKAVEYRNRIHPDLKVVKFIEAHSGVPQK